MNTHGGVVYIIEDDASFRKSMERLMRISGYDAIAFESANSFLSLNAIRHPGCLLLDVRLPDIDGPTLQKTLAKRDIEIPIIFMTGHGTIPMSVQAMKDGAIDFLTKPVKTDILLSAVCEALACDTRNSREELERNRANALIDTLTPREKEILGWIITGRLNKQIAFELAITERTVKAHRSRVMRKLKVASVAELVRLAQKADISPAG